MISWTWTWTSAAIVCLFVHYVSSPSSHGCHKHSQGITDGRQGRGGWGNINNIFNTLKIEAEAKFVTERGENKLGWIYLHLSCNDNGGSFKNLW